MFGSKDPVRARYAIDRFLAVAAESGANGSFLDVGAGHRVQTEYIEAARVFRECYSIDAVPHVTAPNHIVGRFETHPFERRFDAILASHVLEHVPNTSLFLTKIREQLNDGGVLCLIVPPMRQQITTGHVTLWNAGLLLLNCVKAGFDCRTAKIKQKGYNIALIVRKKDCSAAFGFDLGVDHNERYYLPEGLRWQRDRALGIWRFKGNFRSLNW